MSASAAGIDTGGLQTCSDSCPSHICVHLCRNAKQRPELPAFTALLLHARRADNKKREICRVTSPAAAQQQGASHARQRRVGMAAQQQRRHRRSRSCLQQHRGTCTHVLAKLIQHRMLKPLHECSITKKSCNRHAGFADRPPWQLRQAFIGCKGACTLTSKHDERQDTMSDTSSTSTRRPHRRLQPTQAAAAAACSPRARAWRPSKRSS